MDEFLISRMIFLFNFIDNQTKAIIGTAVAVGTAVAGLAYLYKRDAKEPIPTKWVLLGDFDVWNLFLSWNLQIENAVQ